MIAPDTSLHTAHCVLSRARASDVAAIREARSHGGDRVDITCDVPAPYADPVEWAESVLRRWQRGISYAFVVRDAWLLDFFGQLNVIPVETGRRGLLVGWMHPLRECTALAIEIVEAGLAFGFERLGLAEVGAYLVDADPPLRMPASGAHFGALSMRDALSQVGMTVVREVPQGLRRRDRWLSGNRTGDYSRSEARA